MGDWITDIEADYVIVGAGSAGCTLAGRLTEDPAVSVVLVEAGPSDAVPLMDVPIAAGRFLGSRYDWGYRTEPEPGLGGRVLDLAHGRVLGGSSSINSMVYMRGSAGDYDAWAGSGATGWSYAELLPYFLRSECNDRGAGPLHSTSGPLSVSDSRAPHPLSAAFLRAAEEAGYRRVADLTGDDRDGFGYAQATQRGGLRCSAATAYVHPVVDRPNLRLLLEAPVSGLVLQGDRAVGVTASHAGRPLTVRAAREVVLAAGAYHSPQLLMLAGIGPAHHLRALGIDVRCDLPVGLNLQDHLRVAVVFPTHLPTLPRELDVQARDAYQRHGTLPPMANAGETGGFLRSSAGSAALDYYVSGVPTAVGAMLSADGNGVSLVGWTTRPTSSGQVRLRTADPADRPAVRHAYLTTHHDRRTAVDGVARMLEIADQPAFQEVVSGPPVDAPGSRADDAVLAWVRRTGVSMHHPCGTCAIGTVVDPELRVFGVEGLRVVDASVIPTIPGATINATTIAIGERAADLLAARTPVGKSSG